MRTNERPWMNPKIQTGEKHRENQKMQIEKKLDADNELRASQRMQTSEKLHMDKDSGADQGMQIHGMSSVNEERTRRILRRTAELKREKRIKTQRAVTVLCLAASLLLVTGLGLWISSRTGETTSEVVHASGAASLLASNGSLGYILMGILSFLLGACVTTLLFCLSRWRKRREKPEDPDDEL